MSIGKRICGLACAFALLFTVCGALGEAAEPDYYHIGLKVTALMSEITESDAYLSLIGTSSTFAKYRQNDTNAAHQSA